MITYNLANVVNWYGPYRTLEEARVAAKEDYDSGLYAAVGHRTSEEAGELKLLYVGVGASLHVRLDRAHHKIGRLNDLEEIDRHEAVAGVVKEIWLGEVDVPRVPGKRRKKIEPHLDMIEWMTVYFLQVPSNEKKKTHPPDMPGVVLNRWYGINYEDSKPAPVAGWADVIEFDGYANDGNGRANLVWFGPSARVQRIPDATAYGRGSRS